MSNDSYKHIDLGYLYEIADGDTDFVVELITDYIEKVPPRFAELEEALSVKDFEQTRFLAHKMKSSFQFIGAQELIDASNAIEELSPDKMLDQITEQVNLMKPIIENAMKELKHKLASLNA